MSTTDGLRSVLIKPKFDRIKPFPVARRRGQAVVRCDRSSLRPRCGSNRPWCDTTLPNQTTVWVVHNPCAAKNHACSGREGACPPVMARTSRMVRLFSALLDALPAHCSVTGKLLWAGVTYCELCVVMVNPSITFVTVSCEPTPAYTALSLACFSEASNA